MAKKVWKGEVLTDAVKKQIIKAHPEMRVEFIKTGSNAPDAPEERLRVYYDRHNTIVATLVE